MTSPANGDVVEFFLMNILQSMMEMGSILILVWFFSKFLVNISVNRQRFLGGAYGKGRSQVTSLWKRGVFAVEFFF